MSEMNGGQLRHALKQVHMKENMQEEIIMNVRTQMADGTYRRNSFKRMAMSAAAFMLVFGAVSIPSYAAISNLVRARMEAIPRAEVEATEDMIQSQQIHADQFSREYTREERKRMDALRQEYENGMFPENTLTLVENESQVPDGDTLAYTKDTGCFYLPDRELTDEELLQILDFNAARDYALDQSPEVQKAREEAKAEAEERAAQAGGSGILKMKPGEADGEVLQVTAPDGMVFSVMTTDEQGNLYVVAEDRDIEAVMRDDEVVCPTEHCEVWRVSPSGEVAAKLDISEYVKQEVFSPRMIAVAGNGDIYLSTQNDGTAVLAFDAEGNFLNKISYDYKVYTLRTAMGRGRDGKVYAVLWDSIANDGTSVIVELDGRNGSIGDVTSFLLHSDGSFYNCVCPGRDCDLVIFGGQGILGYDLGSASIKWKVPAGELPFSTEGYLPMATLPDGRVLFLDRNYKWDEDDPTNMWVVAEGTKFHYVPAARQ